MANNALALNLKKDKAVRASSRAGVTQRACVLKNCSEAMRADLHAVRKLVQALMSGLAAAFSQVLLGVIGLEAQYRKKRDEADLNYRFSLETEKQEMQRRLDIVAKDKAQLEDKCQFFENCITPQSTQLDILQQHLQQLRETTRLQSIELQATRQDLAEKSRILSSSHNTIRDLTKQNQCVTAALEKAQEELAKESMCVSSATF